MFPSNLRQNPEGPEPWCLGGSRGAVFGAAGRLIAERSPQKATKAPKPSTGTFGKIQKQTEHLNPGSIAASDGLSKL